MREHFTRRMMQVLAIAIACLLTAVIAQSSVQQAGAQTAPLVLDRAKTNMINRITNDFLGRPATADEIDLYLTRFGVTDDESDVRSSVLSSRAFFDRAGGSRSDFITAAYEETLGRAPTSNELKRAASAIRSSDLPHQLQRQALATELLERANYDPDGLGVREISLDTDDDGKIVRFIFELDEPFVSTDRAALSVSINGRQLSGDVRVRAGRETLVFIPDRPVRRFGPIVALAFVQRDGRTRLADLTTPSQHLPDRTVDHDQWPDQVFADQRVIAHYGHHNTAALGVLGETGPVEAVRLVTARAQLFDTPQRSAVGAFEMIVTVAQASAGADGDYSHPTDLAAIEKWIDIAEAAGVYVILDIQPGRSDFLTESQRYESLLLRPHVGLALDPEWRMGPSEVPGRSVGKVSAAEVNDVSLWLSNLTLENDLPEKIFIIHQFQERMISNRDQLIDRPGLATVIHVDGFGSRAEKQATYSRLAVGEPFANGFKLFLDEDRQLYQPHEVLAFDQNPVPDFVSYQ